MAQTCILYKDSWTLSSNSDADQKLRNICIPYILLAYTSHSWSVHSVKTNMVSVTSAIYKV